jgi:hypothetical protein
MSSKTLLETLKAVTGELGFPQPAVVVSSQVLTDIQLRYLCTAACDELLEAHDWQSLTKQFVFTITTGVTEYTLPTDFHRFINDTARVSSDATFNDADEDFNAVQTMSWRRLSASELAFRVNADALHVWDADAHAGKTVSIDYISKNYVIDGTNSLKKAEFTLDSDKTVYHPRLLTSFVKLKFLEVKSLDTRAAAREFNNLLQAAIGSDTPSRTLSLNGEFRLDPLYGDLE